MGADKIPELNRRLQQMRDLFLAKSSTFVQNVKRSTERFTEQDHVEFDIILSEIRQYAMERIQSFINSKINNKTPSFNIHFDTFRQNTTDLAINLDTFREQLEEASRNLKKKQVAKQQLLQRISNKYAITETYKKVIRSFKENAEQKRKKKQLERKMDKVYCDKLMQKCFFPWRALTYKDGYENQVKRQAQSQLMKIHGQFGGIVEVLKQKIQQTEKVIKAKRVAKNQFAYALSKNLLRTISNLSLQVIQLNQISTKDKASEQQTANFMKQVNKLIDTKLTNVSYYKQTMYSTQMDVREVENVNQQPRNAPSAITSLNVNPKRISFA